MSTMHSRPWPPLAGLIPLLLITQANSLALAADTVTVDLSKVAGAPTYRASGFIYGIARDGSQPPNATLTDIKVRFLRAGGAQIGCPNGGYVNGQYTARWNSVKAYYAKAKAIGATLLLLPHDLWGADAVCNVPRWPGDGGDWTDYTAFMTQVIDDAIANGMTGSDVRWELWNEPDLGAFWGGTQSQYFQMWNKGYAQVRAAISGAQFEGPSLANPPAASNNWWTGYLDNIKTNNTVPNYISFHEETGGRDPATDIPIVNSLLSSRSITVTGYDVNEYGTSVEQNPGHSAWYISRLERVNVDALRGNWGMAGGLYEGMGDLVTSTWQPLGQWWIYKRYADQTGLRATVTAGSQADAVAFVDATAHKSIIVVGNKGGVTGAVNVQVNGIPADLQGGGTTQVLIERMPDGTTYVSAPTVVSKTSMTVTGNALTVGLNWTNAQDGYAVTLTSGNPDAGVPGSDAGRDAAVDTRAPDAPTGGASGSGGAPGSGGSATGGALGSGGSATGGASGSGGSSATSGASGSGGLVGSGGAKGTGGAAGSGGSSSTDGAAGTGGTSESGGASGSGGAPGSGGAAGFGGVKGSGGVAGSGGTTTSTGKSTTASGCSCSTGQHIGTSSAPLAELLAFFGLAAFGRRNRQKSSARR